MTGLLCVTTSQLQIGLSNSYLLELYRKGNAELMSQISGGLVYSGLKI